MAHQPGGDPSAYHNYPIQIQPPVYSAPSTSTIHVPQTPAESPTAVRESEAFVTGESEGDGDGDSLPKKKRRRQALSCTECKRRKIKCDRNQPCGPCSRRGEEAKCQWHVVEPVEKYVTREEYNDLKTRFDRLEALVTRAFSVPQQPQPQPSHPHAPPGVTQMGMYGPGPSEGVQYPSMYPAMLPQDFPQPMDVSTHHQHQGPPPSVMSPPRKTSTSSASSPVLSRVRAPSDPKSPGVGAASPSSAGPPKHSPLSFAPPPHPYPHAAEQQSKNCRAQTFTPLGARLRHRTSEGPASPVQEVVEVAAAAARWRVRSAAAL